MPRKELPAEKYKGVIVHFSHDVRIYLLLCQVKSSGLVRVLCAEDLLALIQVPRHKNGFREYWGYDMANLLAKIKGGFHRLTAYSRWFISNLLH